VADLRVHRWVTRAKAACGYFWTNPGCPHVVCACGAHSIINDVIIKGDAVTDEDEFLSAVADSLGVTVESVVVEQVI